MTEQESGLVRPDGRPLRPRSGNCPRCGAGKDKRVNTAGFGAPVICCSVCGCDLTLNELDE